MKNRYYFKTKNIKIIVNKRNYKENVEFTIWYADSMIPIIVKFGTGTLDINLCVNKLNESIIKKYTIPQKIENIFFDDESNEISFVYKGEWSYSKKKPIKMIKDFKIQFLKKKEFEQSKELMIPCLIKSGKYFKRKNK